MVETPDFEQIARRMFPMDHTGHDAILAELSAESRGNLVEQLRLVWNARGAADLAQAMNAYGMAGPYCDNLEHVLRTLDV